MRRTMCFSVMCLTVAFAAPVFAGTDPNLSGEWVGTDADNQGKKIVLRGDGNGTLNGAAFRWDVPRAGVLRCQDGAETLELQYTLDGDRLRLVIGGQAANFKRSEAAPKPPVRVPELPTLPEPANPLAPTPEPDFARNFTGDGVALTLVATGGNAYEGKLRYGDAEYPVKATRDGNRLTGTFTSGGQSFPLSATLAGDTLTLESGGRSFKLAGAAAKAPPRDNPLGGITTSEPRGEKPGEKPGGGSAKPKAPPPALGGVDAGKATRYEHPEGYFSFEMPEGWSVWREMEDGLLLNPGLTETDSLDALISVSYGSLDAEDRNQPVADLLAKYEPELKQALGQQGIRLGQAAGPVEKVSVGDVPGAVRSWAGSTANGQALTVWFGGLVKREYYLSVTAVIVKGKEETFLGKAKRVFMTMKPKPPQRNLQAEEALVGKGFSKSTTSAGGFFATIYTFRAGGVVVQELMFSASGIGGGGADTTESGRYEVIGQDVFLYFQDGQSVGRLTVQNGQITALQIGSAVYSAR